MAVTAEPISLPAGWLRDRSFDLHFIVGIAALALISGTVVIWNPALFIPVLIADLWLLGYHHVIATYTRLCFDKESFRTHRFLVLWLPFLVFGGVLALGYGVGLWVLSSIYLYWQWFHYTRQSWGVSQVYRRKSGGLVEDGKWFAKIAFWAIPVWGILHRSYQDPGTFLGMELKVLPIPELAVDIAEAVALLALAGWLAARALDWLRGRLPVAHSLYMVTHFLIFGVAYVLIEDLTYGWWVRSSIPELAVDIAEAVALLALAGWLAARALDWLRGRLPVAHSLYMVTHFLIFGVAYVLIEDLTYGWLVINIWHNAQYVVFVWLFNTNRFRGGSDPQARFLSRINQIDKSWLYFGVCIGISTVAYAISQNTVALLLPAVVIYQAINFHHYIVDSVIWKVRQKPLQKTLGIAG